MRKQRLYAPFYKKSKSDKKWIRATFTMTNEGVQEVKEYRAYRKDIAVRCYQNWLLAPFLNGIDEIRELRPIKD